jgi:hypothetical protein
VKELLTVVLVDPTLEEEFQEYRSLFEPFELNGELVVCKWNSSGRDVEHALPDLYGKIGFRKDWRVIILAASNVSENRNPFVVLDADDALLRVAQMLGGVPKKIETDVVQSFDELDRLFIRYETSVIEDEQRKKAMHEFGFQIPRPREILLIKRRIVTEDWISDRPKFGVEPSVELKESNFFEQNPYPNACTFIVSEVVGDYFTMRSPEALSFWLTVNTVANTGLPNATLRSGKLYRAMIHVDKSSFQNHFSKLISQIQHVKTELGHRVENLSITISTANATQRYVMPAKDEFSTEVSTSDLLEVSTFSDSMFLKKDAITESKWISHANRILAHIPEVMKNSRRSLDYAVKVTKKNRSVDPGDIVLNEYEKDDLKEQMQDFENKLISPQVTTNPKHFHKRLDVASDRVSDVISTRIPIGRYIGISVGVTLVYLSSFIPIFSEETWQKLTISFSELLGLVVLFLALAGFLSMLIFRKRFRERLYGYNRIVSEFNNNIQSAARRNTTYLLHLSKYQFGLKVLDKIEHHNKMRELYISEASKRQHYMDGIIEKYQQWLSFYELRVIPIMLDRKKEPAIDLDVDNVVEFKQRMIELQGQGINTTRVNVNNIGNTDSISPYPFITHLSIEREVLYDE